MEGNSQALLENKNGSKTRRNKGRLTFSPKTRVRNQFEEGEQVERFNYEVDATGNNQMPGYFKLSPHFKPHTKSILQKHIIEMAGLRKQKERENRLRVSSPQTPRQLNAWALNSFNTGLQPAVSSVGSEEKTNRFRAELLTGLLKKTYGNTWTNAAVRQDELVSEAIQVKAAANVDFGRALAQLEMLFNSTYGTYAPSVLKRMYDGHVDELRKSMGKMSLNDYNDELRHWTEWYNEEMRRIPAAVKANYEKRLQKIMSEHKQKIDDFISKSELNMMKVKIGKQYPPSVKRTLANRLRNAKAVHNAFL